MHTYCFFIMYYYRYFSAFLRKKTVSFDESMNILLVSLFYVSYLVRNYIILRRFWWHWSLRQQSHYLWGFFDACLSHFNPSALGQPRRPTPALPRSQSTLHTCTKEYCDRPAEQRTAIFDMYNDTTRLMFFSQLSCFFYLFQHLVNTMFYGTWCFMVTITMLLN